MARLYRAKTTGHGGEPPRAVARRREPGRGADCILGNGRVPYSAIRQESIGILPEK